MKKAFLIFLSVILIQGLMAQETSKTISRKIEKTFDYNSHAQIIIYAERGNISIQGWDQEQVSVVLTVSAKNKYEEIARRELDYIKYNLLKSRGNIFLNNKIVIPEGEKNKEISSILTATYVIRVPSWCNTTVFNKFGKLTVNNTGGVISGELRYSDMFVNSYSGIIKMDISVGDFNSMKSELKGDIKTKYANITLSDNSGKLVLNSESGSIKITPGAKKMDLTMVTHATDVLINNKNCLVFDLKIEGSNCPFTISKECYTPDSQLLKSTYQPSGKQDSWTFDYHPVDKLPKIRIIAGFGSVSLF